ncbi:acetate kinase [Chitinasiproducens palmae]|uniref:Acetate kinase n=2 Tax=Chitinasiproducens palmae TaxID=1770053 RepID=A0A1H2PL63_9BURK|nr:acetate kinase [Chitinasiproducens palmae]
METLFVVNAGSSSLKFRLFERRSDGLHVCLRGQLSGIGSAEPAFEAADHEGGELVRRALAPAQAHDAAQAQSILGEWLHDHLGAPPSAVAHRVVHGGPDIGEARLIDEALLAQLEQLVPLAPLHQPAALAVIRTVQRMAPGVPQIACFDTAFHRSHPPVADRFALPRRFYAEGVRRYGFHGLSYEYIASQLRTHWPALAAGRVAAAHLGAGASVCGLVDGRSVSSSMGFSALDGIPMATRPGQLDPGVVLWMLDRGMNAREIEALLYKQSGLAGLSGTSGDMRELIGNDSADARLALDYFALYTAQALAALGTAMGGLDALVFTAGIGEHAAPVRASICAHLAWLGVRLDAARNVAHASRISSDDSAIEVRVIPTNEEEVIARHAHEVLEARAWT